MPSPLVTPLRPVVTRVLATLLPLVPVVPLVASALSAQTPAPPTPAGDAAVPVRTDPFCWRGRPLPRCRSFALFELGVYGRLATTRLRERYTLPSVGAQQRDEEAFSSQFGWSAGAMRNLDASTAVGGALVLAFGDAGNTVAGTVRLRRWTGRGTSVELAGGPGAAQVPLPIVSGTVDGVDLLGGEGIGWRPALLAEARANASDLIALSVRGVVVPRAGGRQQAAVLAGASTGSGLAAIGTVGLGILTALAIAALAGAY
jgi:hypothetical protein